MADHDQRFKELLREFFPEFLELVVPEWVAQFDPSSVEWLDQELFTDPPQGDVRYVDLVAKVHSRQPASPEQDAMEGPWLCLIHIEIEAADRVEPLRGRVYSYSRGLRFRHGLPVLSIGLYLRVGLEGRGWDVYEEYFFNRRVLRFEYPYLGLPALEASAFVLGPNLLGTALSALMRVQSEQRPRLKVEALEHIAKATTSNYRKLLLMDCVDAYLPLEGSGFEEYLELLQQDRYQEAKFMAMTTFERGIQQGLRRMLEVQLERKFGPLSETAQQRLREWPSEQLPQLGCDLLLATTLRELKLED